jgi:hypothetical protein
MTTWIEWQRIEKIPQNVNKLEHLRQVDIPRWLTILIPTPNKNKINSLSVPQFFAIQSMI